MATVTRVLPWRRSAAPPAIEVAPLVATYRSRHPKANASVITRAYELSKQAHVKQVRTSGEAYITHPLAVAGIVAELGLDDTTIAAALLHDAVEDTELTLSDVEAGFGPTVAAIVDGVTKLERLQFESKEAQQAATMRKMLVAMAKDVRVLIIKLADRLHNMRTLAAMPDWKQTRTAQETVDIYAPLAHRLGMQDLKQQLEDLAFAAMYPKRYAEIDHMVATRAPERELYLAQVLEDVRHRLAELRIDADVSGRPKHLWSIYEKMVVKGKAFDDIYDLVGIRVTVDAVKDCYAALGSIHSTWTPVQGRFKDYIAMPKFNLYQSLHTTVVGPQGKPLEVQIRTREMHNRAEFGVAAHYAYKGDGTGGDMPWLSRIIDWEKDTNDPEAFMETLKVDLEQDEVYVFTPKGKVVTLAAGATPIDFAYTIHTDVGHACIGARVNGRLVPLDSKLSSGDTVEIFTSKVEGAGPSRDWMQMVATPRAANKIRQWFSRERREDAIENGREDLVKAMRREGLPVQKIASGSMLADTARELNYADLDALYAAIGENHVSAKSVGARIAKALRGDPEAEEQLPTTVRQPRRPNRSGANGGTIGVHVEGLDDVMVRLSKCCTPVPGDELLGFITKGRGVSVHRADCANAVSLSHGARERVIEVEWDIEHSGMFVASIEVKALDRARLLSDVAKALSDSHVNILGSSSVTGPDRISKMRFEFELGDTGHLESMLSAIKRIDSVYDAYRIVPGKGGSTVAPGRQKRFTLLHSNDMHGDFLAETEEGGGPLVGGLAVLSGYLNEVRATEPNVIYAIAGDMLQGSMIDSEFQGLSTFEIMNYLSPDVVTIGNHELDYGFRHLLFLEKIATFPIINANLYIQQFQQRIFSPFAVLERDGFSVMFIGVVTDEVLASLKLDTSIASLITLEDAAREVGKVCNAYRNDDIDLTVLMTHIGFEQDKVLAELLDPAWGIDIIIGGHSHTVMEQPTVVNGVQIAQAAVGTDQIGRFDLLIDDDTNAIVDCRWELVPIVDGLCEPDRDLERFIDTFKDQVDRKYNRVLTKLRRQLTHPQREIETEIGNLFADILSTADRVDLVLLGSGSIRQPELGPAVTLGDLNEIFTFDGPMHRVSVDGARLLCVFAHAMRVENRVPGESNCFQVNRGVAAVYDDATATLVSLAIGGEPVDPTRTYTVAIQDYTLSSCDSLLGVTADELGPSKVITTSTRDVLVEHLTANQLEDAVVEGRLVYRG